MSACAVQCHLPQVAGGVTHPIRALDVVGAGFCFSTRTKAGIGECGRLVSVH